jgi:TRAP-type transport system periplasmic protein
MTMPARGFRLGVVAVAMSATCAGSALSALAPGPASAQTIKIATLAPNGTAWGRILDDQTADWKRDTAGRVDVRLYPGGVAGDDPDLIRKMRIGQLHGASLTVRGLVDIDEAFNVFTIPLFFQSPAEVEYVLEAMTPLLRARLESKGFVLLNWGYAGWAHLYSKRPVESRADLQSQKLFMWAAEERTMRIWRTHGLQPVSIPGTEVTMAIQTGMIEVLATTPLVALTFQWFRQASHQLEDPLAPLIGATVLTKRGWNSIAEGDRAAVLAGSGRAGRRYFQDIPDQDARAVEAMRERGLTVTRVTGAERPAWEAWAESLATEYRGAVVPADVYDVALKARAEFRNRRTAGR